MDGAWRDLAYPTVLEGESSELSGSSAMSMMVLDANPVLDDELTNHAAEGASLADADSTGSLLTAAVDASSVSRHRAHAEQVHGMFLRHLIGGSPLVMPGVTHVDQLATTKRSLLIVSRASPEAARCVELSRFAAVSAHVRKMGRATCVRRTHGVIESMGSASISVRLATQLGDAGGDPSCLDLVLEAEFAPGALRPRRLTLALCGASLAEFGFSAPFRMDAWTSK